MTDRPATEPRTPTGRAYLAELNGEKEPPEEWRDARGYLPKASRRAWEHDRDMILAIEAEAAQGAAPRAEGLPVERLARAIKSRYGLKESESEVSVFLNAIFGRAASPAALDVPGLREFAEWVADLTNDPAIFAEATRIVARLTEQEDRHG